MRKSCPQLPLNPRHRQPVAAKWNYSNFRKFQPGRPPVSAEITQLILRMAGANPTWGYDRIQGALANLGHCVADTTVGNIRMGGMLRYYYRYAA